MHQGDALPRERPDVRRRRVRVVDLRVGKAQVLASPQQRGRAVIDTQPSASSALVSLSQPAHMIGETEGCVGPCVHR